MDEVVQFTAEAATKVGTMLMEASQVAARSGGRASPTSGLGIAASIGAGYSLYRCVQFTAQAADAGAAKTLANSVMPSPQLIKDTLDRVAVVSAQSNGRGCRRRQRRHSWTAGEEKSTERERHEAALASLLASTELDCLEYTRQRSASLTDAGHDAPVTPVTSPDAVEMAGRAWSPDDDHEVTRELQRQLDYKLAEVRLLQRQHAQALSEVAQTHVAVSTVARKWRQKVQRQATRELLRSASDAREKSEVAKGEVASQVAERILARHPDWNAHEAAAGVTRVVKIHTVLRKAGSVRRTTSWGTPRANDSRPERSVDFFLFEFAVQLPPKRLSRSHTYTVPLTPQQLRSQPTTPQPVPALAVGRDREPELELALSPSGEPGESAHEQGSMQRQPSFAGSASSLAEPSPSHEAVAEAAVARACANSDSREMSMVVRFSYGHAKHEAMEAAGLFEGAWPPVLYPPHRVTRTLAARLLGGAPSEEEERDHAILRSQELQQYYERVFRLPAVTQRCDLEELVSWIGDGPEKPDSHADATLWESPQPLRRSVPPSSPLATPVRSAVDAHETQSDSVASVRSYAHMGSARLFMDSRLVAEQVN